MQGDFYNALLQQQIQNHAETMEKLGSLSAKLESVHHETRKTNGRVTELEKQVHELMESRSYARGSVATVSAMSVVLGSAVTLIWEYIKSK